MLHVRPDSFAETSFLTITLWRPLTPFSTAGHGWTDQGGWLTENSVCDWELVEQCDAGGMITELDLRSNNLVGKIPVEITHVRLLGKSIIAGADVVFVNI